MRIQRSRSRLGVRSQRRRSGCMPLALVLGIMFGIVIASWDWIGQRLSTITARDTGTELRDARQAFDRGDLDETITIAQQVWASQPDQIESLSLLARALIYRSYSDYDLAGDRDTALELTTEAMDRFPSDPAVLTIHAFALQAAGKPVEASRLANYVLNRQPDNTLARIASGLAYGGVGSYDNALRENQIAANSAGAWRLDAQRALAISLSDLGRYDEAAEAVQEAIALNNKLSMLHFERALYAMQVGDVGAATAAYFRVLAFDPENVKARLRLCELSSILSERDQAIDYCQQVTERAPGWPDGWYRLGREYFLKGDFGAAQRALNRCSTLQVIQNVPVSERRFECWYLQGQAAEILGDCENLLAVYNEFRVMAAEEAIPQTWTYPPEGPPICASE